MITRDEFKVACCTFLDRRSNQQNDYLSRIFARWAWAEHPQITSLGYMTRTASYTRQDRSLLSSEEVADLDSDINAELEAEDEASTEPSPSLSILFSMSVVYSPSYQLPAFHFTAHDTNGGALPLTEALRSSLFRRTAFAGAQVSSFSVMDADSPFPLISYGEHPITGEPSWYIHPCETAKALTEIMDDRGEIFPSREAYLVSLLEAWFMVIGNVVDLEV